MANQENTYTTLSTPMAAAIIVLGALLALILVRRGFRGVNVAGVKLSV